MVFLVQVWQHNVYRRGGRATVSVCDDARGRSVHATAGPAVRRVPVTAAEAVWRSDLHRCFYGKNSVQ